MTIGNSVIEDIQLVNGVDVYIQTAARGGVALNFSGKTQDLTQYLTANEALELAIKLTKVAKEAE